MYNKEVYIIAAKRTAIGSFMKSLASVDAVTLGSTVIKGVLGETNIPKDAISEVIMGQVLTTALGQNPVRQAAIKAGVPIAVPSYGVSQVCGSGLRAVDLAAQSILAGRSDLVICGGMENMSQAVHAAYLRAGHKFGDIRFIDTMLKDGLSDAFSNDPMGITAENIAEKYKISRTKQDEFAHLSQTKAAKAIKNGWFRPEIVPVELSGKSSVEPFITDEFVRPDSSIEALSKLKPAFIPGGTVTAGNSSGINDGAAALILASADAVRRYDLTPLARIVNFTCTGVNPDYMGIGPVPAIDSLLQRCRLTAEDIDIFEINEAFAAQAAYVIDSLALPYERVNVGGGAIALGHPIGASGARILVTLIYHLLRARHKTGVASLCVGGGMGLAMLIESCCVI